MIVKLIVLALVTLVILISPLIRSVTKPYKANPDVIEINCIDGRQNER